MTEKLCELGCYNMPTRKKPHTHNTHQWNDNSELPINWIQRYRIPQNTVASIFELEMLIYLK